MSAFTPMTRDDAVATAKRDGLGFVVTIRMAAGDASIATRSRQEAVNWVDFNRDWMHPGTDRIEAVT